MLRMGFIEDVERILQSVPASRQVALFSATMPKAISAISQSYLNDPVEISVKTKTSTATNIAQRYVQVRGPHKLDALTRILEVETFDAMLVFVRTKQLTEELSEKLQARGFNAAAINGDVNQAQRDIADEVDEAAEIGGVKVATRIHFGEDVAEAVVVPFHRVHRRIDD